jgi:molecular chaperone Hsp33
MSERRPRETKRDTTDGSEADGLAGDLQLGVAANGDLRWAAVDVTGPTEDVRRRLDLSPVASVALGRALAAAALLLRFTSKFEGRLVLEVLGDGPIRKILAEVDSQGRLRGLVGEPRLDTPDDGSMAISWAVGRGILRVTREGPGGRSYSSQVELVTGELGRDLVHFLNQSQQIRSAALLGVLPRPTGVGAAGGILVEAFPSTPEETLARLENNIAALEGVSAYLDQGGVPALRDAVLAGFDRDDLERHPLVYRCRCHEERLRQALQGMPGEDLDSITDEAGLLIAECAFCGASYEFARSELQIH